jgi:hypothetical protein
MKTVRIFFMTKNAPPVDETELLKAFFIGARYRFQAEQEAAEQLGLVGTNLTDFYYNMLLELTYALFDAGEAEFLKANHMNWSDRS